MNMQDIALSDLGIYEESGDKQDIYKSSPNRTNKHSEADNDTPMKDSVKSEPFMFASRMDFISHVKEIKDGQASKLDGNRIQLKMR